MKKQLYILCMAVSLLALGACRGEDDFTESIFNTDIEVVDKNATTAQFDQWLYDNFLQPYNVELLNITVRSCWLTSSATCSTMCIPSMLVTTS